MGGCFSSRKKGKGAWKMKLLILIFWVFFGCNSFSVTNKEDILFQEGLYHYQKGRYDLAIKAFASVIELNPTYPKIEEMLISSIKKRGETLKTEEKIEKHKEEKKEEVKPLEYEPFKDILTLPPEETKTLTADENDYLFGRKLISLGMNEEGITFLEALLKEKPKIGFADKILFTIGEAKKDEGVINRLLKEYPKTALKYEARLFICNISKDYKKAIIGYMELIKDLSNGTLTDLFSHLPPQIRNPDEIMIESQIGLGNSYKELGSYSQSIVEYKKIVDEYPKSQRAGDALFYIADIYDRYPKARDFLKAVEFYGRLIREYPDSKWTERAKIRKKHIEENYL